MARWMGAAFILAGFALIAFLISIIGSAVRESVLAPDLVPDRLRRRRGRYAMVVAAFALSAVLWRANAWWGAVDKHFQATRLYKTLEIPGRIEKRDGTTYLTLTLKPEEKDWHDRTPLVADHGKLMHLFLVSENGCRPSHICTRLKLPTMYLKQRYLRFLREIFRSTPISITRAASLRR